MLKNTSEAIILFPHQLFEKNTLLKKEITIYLVEAPRYFVDFSYHKKKLILHRASMKAYYYYLTKNKFQVRYIEFQDYENFFKELSTKKYNTLHYIDPVDIPFEKKFLKKLKNTKSLILKHESPAFLSSTDWLKKVFKNKKNYFMHSFYIQQRKKLNILVTKEKKPLGGRWSYDDQNRKPLPNNIKIPAIWTPKKNDFTQKALRYIEKHFANNPGSHKDFMYPVTFKDAQKWFDNFLKTRFAQFGPYEDAIIADEHYLFHSVLSPLLNIGLLTPAFVVEKTLNYAQQNNIAINSAEGFIRQIIGWREFVRAVYILEEKKQRSSNFFDNDKKIPSSFWKGSTSIEPIDITIQKILKTSYAHHIERLMILGNFMLLCSFSPQDVYNWFMELFIDAYDWVMVPNVYGMSQFCDGGLMTTKPYISGSNYILKMSNYRKNGWTSTWNALYWHFLEKNKKKLASLPRMRLIYTQLKKMKKTTLDTHIKNARNFLKKI